MALPRALRPAVLIRRKALYDGVFGPSKFWKLIAVWVFGKATLKKFFGRNVEVLDAGPLGVGRYLSVETAKPLTRRRRRKLAKAGVPVPTEAQVKALAQAEAKAALRARAKQ
jgi:hypothetical protein